jgi:hypothetical protein
MIRSLLRVVVCTAVLFGATAAPVSAAEPLFASKSAVARFWSDFKDYWSNAFKNQSAVTMAVLGTGAIALVIITRVKGNK